MLRRAGPPGPDDGAPALVLRADLLRHLLRAAADRLGGQVDALGTPDKRLYAYPGGHVRIAGEQMEDLVRFLCA